MILDFNFNVFELVFSKLINKLSPDILEVIVPNLLSDISLASVLKYASDKKVSVPEWETKLSTKFISLVLSSITCNVAYRDSNLSEGTVIKFVVIPIVHVWTRELKSIGPIDVVPTPTESELNLDVNIFKS